MGGRASRVKGGTFEYEIRDYLRANGFINCHRVPASGAAQGFKGDVVGEKDGKFWRFEAKRRAEAFTTLYVLWDHVKLKRLALQCRGMSVLISDAVSDVLDQNAFYLHAENFGKEHKRGIARIVSLYKYVQSCDILVIRDDRKPALFLRYFPEAAIVEKDQV